MIECMFDGSSHVPDPEFVARMQECLGGNCPTVTAVSAAMLERICGAARVENRAVAVQLAEIGALFGYRLARCSQSEDWCVDTMESVAAEIAAARRIGQRAASDLVRYARAMRERLPKGAEVFRAGDIDYRAFQTIVFRTDLIVDDEVLAGVDAEVAVKVRLWPSLSLGRLGAQVDRIVARVD